MNLYEKQFMKARDKPHTAHSPFIISQLQKPEMNDIASESWRLSRSLVLRAAWTF